ncbi:probable serine/threonine-protein kinase DDB_G0278509 [Mya arenaria]|uniref:probable serine/threonine-protein kinase DDB_G0278509 n=1 Tax=Mya arenaria TaxID=6604 RepID=UPI0022E40B38|nr:probable serine/threonine-protein kinase DDB_G0278509 [Mya arenaria]
MDTDSNCPINPPCNCFFDKIYCQGFKLSQFPAFKRTTRSYFHIEIDAWNNNFLQLPSNAFQNLQFTNASAITIYLGANSIHYIDDNAFAGIENILVYLGLSNNNLRTLPIAFQHIPHLGVLDLTGNPLYKLDSLTMTRLGSSLVDFMIDINHLIPPGYPSEMGLLRKLKVLTLNGDFDKNNISSSAFDTQENTLTSLNIYGINNMPTAMCSLRQLKSIQFSSNNVNTRSSSGFLPTCSTPLNSVKSVVLSSNSLTDFPDVFLVFPDLEYLSANYEYFVDILPSKLPTNTQLKTFNLQSNELNKVPSGINNLVSLDELDLTWNQITSIGANDLAGLTKLTKLYLNGNPITTIAAQAFANNRNLVELQLTDLQITTLPASLTSLALLERFSTDHSPISCTCADLSSLKGWGITSLYYQSKCSNSNGLIKDFITITLASC